MFDVEPTSPQGKNSRVKIKDLSLKVILSIWKSNGWFCKKKQIFNAFYLESGEKAGGKRATSEWKKHFDDYDKIGKKKRSSWKARQLGHLRQKNSNQKKKLI